MANQEQLDLLMEGSTIWNTWREQHPEIRPDLSGVHLYKADLSGANLGWTNLTGANLYQAHLDSADLRYANLSEADLSNANLFGANLSGAHLSRANLSEADLSNANLFGADLSNANMLGAHLSRANLNSANLHHANLQETYLEGANLSWAKITQEQLLSLKSLKGTTMPDEKKYVEREEVISLLQQAGSPDKLDLSRSNLMGIDLAGLDLHGVNLSNANLLGANLSGADLREANLNDADFTSAKLRGANLKNVNFGPNLKGEKDTVIKLRNNIDLANAYSAKFSRVVELKGADLSKADLRQADLTLVDLSFANLQSANLSFANLQSAKLTGANLSGADLSGADLTDANLREADLTDANLTEANLRHVNLTDAILTGAICWYTDFGYTNLQNAKGLERVDHRGPSSLNIHTLYYSEGNIPEMFLKGTGVNDTFITYIHSLVGKPIEYYSCFISYSSKDDAFARRLYADLQSHNVRCWFAPEDLKWGERIRTGIDEAVRLHDKLLLILSKQSVNSGWVEREVKIALAKEKKEKRTVLFPVRLDGTVFDCPFDWATEIRRERNIGDFTRWKQHDTYQKAFTRLLHDLKA